MSTEHLQGKRTGRPRGAKSRLPVRRDAWWAYRNLAKPDAVPPSALAARLLALGREHPDRLALCLAKLDALAREAARRERKTASPKERQPAPIAAAQPELKAKSTPPISASPAPPPASTRQPKNGDGTTLQLPDHRQPRNVRTVFMPHRFVVQALMRYRASISWDINVIACKVDPDRQGVVFTISSAQFTPVAEGQPIPELAPRFAR
jgi:hypothetical protein